MENSNVIKPEYTEELYRRLAGARVKNGDPVGGLGFLFSAISKGVGSLGVYMDIADIYADMGLLELSNTSWFRYLDKAPRIKQSAAYEELAINFFYLDNLWASGYYFHKKISEDGFIRKENLDQEIIDFLSETTNSKEAYYVAYPFDRANYAYCVKRAKRALALGDFNAAEKIFDAIPKECLSEEASGDYAVALYLQQKDAKAISVAKASLEKNGGNVTAYCNLSTAYRGKGEHDKARYYYEQALAARTGDNSEAYKICACALDLGDTATAIECLKIILGERPYDVDMKFFYGLSLINVGEYKEAEKTLRLALRIDPEDDVIAYYHSAAKRLYEGADEERSAEEKLLPFKYVKDYPQRVCTKMRRRIRDWFNSVDNGGRNFNTVEKIRTLKWGVMQNDFDVAHKAIIVAAHSKSSAITDMLRKLLINPQLEDRLRRLIVFSLLAGGYRGKISALAGSVFLSAKPAKLLFDGKLEGALYSTGYALCVSKVLFYGYEETNKIAFAVNKLYTALGTEAYYVSNITPELMAALILSETRQSRFTDKKEICEIFDVDVADFENFKCIYQNALNASKLIKKPKVKKVKPTKSEYYTRIFNVKKDEEDGND